MKITLYIRSPKAGKCTMDARLEEEPCYDSVRVANLATEIKRTLDEIIDDCQTKGYVEYGKYTKRDKQLKIENTKENTK